MCVKPTGNKFSICVMNFYYFNNEGKIIKDIDAEGMIGILRAIGILSNLLFNILVILLYNSFKKFLFIFGKFIPFNLNSLFSFVVNFFLIFFNHYICYLIFIKSFFTNLL